MEQPINLKILFVLNPVSGGKKKIDWEPLIRNYFKERSHIIEFFVLTGAGDDSSIGYWFEKFKPDRVVAVGGDGTISLVAKQLLGKDMAMGILPAGSANGMAKELEIPEEPDEAIDIIVNGEIKCCDVIKINDKDICFHLADFGLNARLIKYFDESPLRGMWGYVRMVLKVVWYKKLMEAKIKIDGDNEIHTKAFMIVIANASKYGTGAVVNPDGKVDDGVFEIVIMRKFSLNQLFKMFLSYKNFNPKKVEILKARKVSIKTEKATHFQVDGEFKGKIDKVNAEIIPAQLNLLVK
ncbi:MAG: diacylglycerol kinase family lipid kinase [Bacteroidota bacterium]|nr:diacylglycerol kinase family lipid kinase [Bacteroidota bacterium]